jgi:flavin reductase (DIM6/NTAB) family NADH-FMN oxidoreductase RutF
MVNMIDRSRPRGKLAERRAFRGAFRALASPVAVLLVADGRGGVRGMTCTSAVSLSGEPPMVLVCTDDKTGMAELIESAGSFSINYLAHGYDSIARAFSSAGRDLADLAPKIIPGRTMTPTLGYGTVSVLECELEYLYPGGDHSILCGLVRHARFQAEAAPMLYGAGAYGQFSPIATKPAVTTPLPATPAGPEAIRMPSLAGASA